MIKSNMRVLTGALFLALGILACKSEAPTATTTDNEPHGLIMANMDTTVNPRDDFYNYVNGSWMETTEIPDDRSSWGGFSVLRKSTDADVLEIISDAKAIDKYTADTDQAKALVLFDGKMNEEVRNELGVTPLQPTLDVIAAIENISDLQTVLMTKMAANSPMLTIYANADLNNSEMNAVYLSQSRLGLPDRDYYLDQDEKSVEIREKYVEHITRMLQFLGKDEAASKLAAEKILAMETTLAEPRLNKVERRDTRNYNNPRSLAEVQEMLPSIDIQQMINDLGIADKGVDTFMVTQPRYLAALNEFLENTPIEDLKTLVGWSTLNSSTSMLSSEIERANWEFYSEYLRGSKEQRPADERALALVNGTVGEALGKLYVDAKFPPEAKAKAELMIANVIAAFQDRISQLDWMSEETKMKAIEKLDKFTVKIGYPDEWEDYSTMEVSADKNHFENRMAVRKWMQDKNLSEIGEPVDKSEWGMSPQTVNAYFNPQNNEIVFPAAILQPPFYDYLADDAVNYGGIGAVIGHEISHAFDDSGARFDGDGNLVNWWTDEDLEKFTERGDALAAQYSAIEVLDSVFIDGKFTLGENIVDRHRHQVPLPSRQYF
ncbi:MAG: M13 family metallopeptidase, partial [Bacteroidota bacterium]